MTMTNMSIWQTYPKIFQLYNYVISDAGFCEGLFCPLSAAEPTSTEWAIWSCTIRLMYLKSCLCIITSVYTIMSLLPGPNLMRNRSCRTLKWLVGSLNGVKTSHRIGESGRAVDRQSKDLWFEFQVLKCMATGFDNFKLFGQFVPSILVFLPKVLKELKWIKGWMHRHWKISNMFWQAKIQTREKGSSSHSWVMLPFLTEIITWTSNPAASQQG
jgi:hypothetical protein